MNEKMNVSFKGLLTLIRYAKGVENSKNVWLKKFPIKSRVII